MLDNGYNLFTLVINFCMGIYDRINSYVPFWGTLLSLLFVFCFIKFFVAPFIGVNHSKSIEQSVTDTRFHVSQIFKKGGKKIGF